MSEFWNVWKFEGIFRKFQSTIEENLSVLYTCITMPIIQCDAHIYLHSNTQAYIYTQIHPLNKCPILTNGLVVIKLNLENLFGKCDNRFLTVPPTKWRNRFMLFGMQNLWLGKAFNQKFAYIFGVGGWELVSEGTKSCQTSLEVDSNSKCTILTNIWDFWYQSKQFQCKTTKCNLIISASSLTWMANRDSPNIAPTPLASAKLGDFLIQGKKIIAKKN